MAHLFTYGSLMHPRVWKSLIQKEFDTKPFTLHHFERRALVDRDYPGMIASSGQKVNGLLYIDIGSTELEILDKFEGKEYCRISIGADHGLEHDNIQAFLYIGPEHNLLPHDWDFEDFVDTKIEQFRSRFSGWH